VAQKNPGEDTTRVTSVHAISENLDGTDCVVQIYGPHLGRKYDLYDSVATIGRDPQNTIVLDSDSVSRRHAVIELCDTGRLLRDLDSTNGTYLNDILVRSAVLGNGDLIKIGDTIFKYLSGHNVESSYHEEIYRMTIHDGLTQISNKRYMFDYLDKELSRARRYSRDLAVLMIDIDHFKDVNDRFGHLTGDYVLKEMAALLSKRIRKEELFARYGGEEFVVVLPESTKDVAVAFGEIVRKMVEEHEFEFEGHPVQVTISVGVGCVTAETTTAEELVKVADEKLYEAKRTGRNRVCS
jgi:diguanylate cyclase (GGDEF)-like protein